MMLPDFDDSDWEARLSDALRELAKAQDTFLKDYWDANGYPTRTSFNGVDDTPFPTGDYSDVYHGALNATAAKDAAYYKPLVEALAPVRSILRVHPAIGSVLKMQLGPEAFRVSINNSQAHTTVEYVVAGLMARQCDRTDKKFLLTARELNSLLSLASWQKVSPLDNELDLGLDIDLFYGAKIEERYELDDGYFIAPFREFEEFLSSKWFEDRAPDQVRARDFEMFFGIVAPFRWQPRIQHANARISDERPRDVPVLFHRVAAEFAELLSVVLERPITWVYDFPGSISKVSCQLLGQVHQNSGQRKGEFVGNYHDPFRDHAAVNTDHILQAVELFSKKRETNYATIAPLIHRLAEAQRTFGRFAKEDRILDLAIIFERYFPNEKTYKQKLSKNISTELAATEQERAQIQEDIQHLYDVRNALVHGAKNEGDAELLREIDVALKNGFAHARSLLLKSIA